MALAAAKAGIAGSSCQPRTHPNRARAGVTVRGAETLRQVIEFVRGRDPAADTAHCGRKQRGHRPDLATYSARNGPLRLELAAAGRHHLAMFGSPGAGKTMLAQRLPSILPPLDDAAALAVTACTRSPAHCHPWLGSSGGHRSRHRTTPHPRGPGRRRIRLARPGALSLAHEGYFS